MTLILLATLPKTYLGLQSTNYSERIIFYLT
jgi:hypothetical protein